MTILDTLQKGTAYLEKHGIDEARLNMQHLLAHALRCERMQLYLDFDRPLEEEMLEVLRDMTKRRAKGEPLQHLVGTVEFHGREFATDSRALIPRPETEELVGHLLERRRPEPGARILDMGAGSGVIGLTLAAELAESVEAVVLADLSAPALELAAENRERLGIDESRVALVCGDLFEKVEGRFDLIASNLPYVAASEIGDLSPEVRNDPVSALDGGEEGTELMIRFLNECGPFLKPCGTLAMEFGAGQAESLAEAAEDAGLESVEILKDAAGRSRFLFAINPVD